MVAAVARLQPGPQDLLPALPALLDAVASPQSLAMQLDAVTRFVERLAPSLRCSILLADTEGGTLHNGASPNLPAGYTAAITGMAYGEGRGSCGTAAARLEMVIVADIQRSPLWIDFRDIASAYGLAACWSMPIADSEDRLLGTFAMYFSEPREPTGAELDVLRVAAPITALVIQRHRDRVRLRASEVRYQELAECCPDGLLAHRAGNIVYANQGAARLLGYETADRLVGQSLQVFELSPDEDRIRHHRSGIHSGWLRRGDASLLPVEVTASMCELAGTECVLLMIRDVTARHALESALSDASNREQELIGYNLHDGLCQELTGISMLVSALASRVRQSDTACSDDLDTINGLLTRTIKATKRIATGMAPVTVERAGLTGALVTLCDSFGAHHGLKIRLRTRPGADAELSTAAATHLYHIAKEALINVSRHAGARRVQIRFAADQARYALVISDDGRGLGGEPMNPGLGTAAMRYRAERLGGFITFEPRRPTGTHVRVLFPRRGGIAF